METPLDVLSRAASLVHADDEKRKSEICSLLCCIFIDLCILLNLTHVEKGLQKPFTGHIPQVQNQYVAFKLVSTQERTVPVILEVNLIHTKVPLSSQLCLRCW